MNQLIEKLKNNKKSLAWGMAITVIALALALVVTVVGVIVFLASDDEAPVIKGPDGDVAVVYLGDNPMYKSYVSVSDNRDDYTLEVDPSQFDKTQTGTYNIYYVATDGAGNRTEYVLRLTVKERKYSEDTLMSMVAEIAEDLGLHKEMTKTELVRKIYDYVNSPNVTNGNNANIKFSNYSNAPNQRNQSGIRKDWEIDWVEEAILTLKDSMSGDCYTYYSVSKAFFEYFGIENVGIQRSESAGDGTHFWSAVKVEGGWYYYDSTRLAGKFGDGTNNGCLMTEEKMRSYRTSEGKDGFYTFVKRAGFPSISVTSAS